jgi:hypothetical protein
MSFLAGITMLGAARLASGPSPDEVMRKSESELSYLITELRRSLDAASKGRESCGSSSAIARNAMATLQIAKRAADNGGRTSERFFGQIRELGTLVNLTDKHCVRGKAIKQTALAKSLPQTRIDLGGATKICVGYQRYPSGKVRCSQWSSGPGYVPGPQDEEWYRIQAIRDAYANRLCPDPSDRKKCGLARNYRYRRSLPYLPREVASRDAAIPDVTSGTNVIPGSRSGVVKVVALPPAPSLKKRKKKKP